MILNQNVILIFYKLESKRRQNANNYTDMTVQTNKPLFHNRLINGAKQASGEDRLKRYNMI